MCGLGHGTDLRNLGGPDVTVAGHTLTVEADGKRFSRERNARWNNADVRRAKEVQVLKVTSPLSKLDAISNGSSETGCPGDISLKLDEHVQSNLSSFVEKAKNPELRVFKTS